MRANVNIYLERVEVLKRLEKKRCNTKDMTTREVREHGYMHTVLPEIFAQVLFSLNFTVGVGPHKLSVRIFLCTQKF